jgi:hypothetical protein
VLNGCAVCLGTEGRAWRVHFVSASGCGFDVVCDRIVVVAVEEFTQATQLAVAADQRGNA